MNRWTFDKWTKKSGIMDIQVFDGDRLVADVYSEADAELIVNSVEENYRLKDLLWKAYLKALPINFNHKAALDGWESFLNENNIRTIKA